MELRDRLEHLEKILEFAYMNLPNATAANIRNMKHDLGLVILGVPLRDPFLSDEEMEIYFNEWTLYAPKGGQFRSNKSSFNLFEVKDKLRGFIEKTFLRLNDCVSSGQTWIDYDEFHQKRHFSTTTHNLELEARLVGKTEARERKDGPVMTCDEARWNYDDVAELAIAVTSRPTPPSDALFFRFIENLDGVPFTFIGRCPECNHWFIRKSKRDRTYCSRRCAQTVANRVAYSKRKAARRSKVSK